MERMIVFKRTFACFLLISLLLGTLTGCASSQAKKVMEQIDRIGGITLASGSDITAAEDAYAALSEAAQGKVENYSKLTAAREGYNRIFNVYALIEQIGVVTKESEAAIIAAEAAYQDLALEERVAITNVATLTAARTAFDEIPTVVELTVENFKDYFTLGHSSTTTKEDIGRYGRRISGSVTVKPRVSLEALDGVTAKIRVNCTVGRPVDHVSDTEKYETEQLNVTIYVSGAEGSGSASFRSDLFISPIWYPSVKVSSVSVVAVTGSVTVK